MIKFYTQPNCPFCDILENKLKVWCINYEKIDIKQDKTALEFMKTQGHRQVPQLYIENFNINDGHLSEEFTEKDFYDRMDIFIEQTPSDIIEKLISEHHDTV